VVEIREEIFADLGAEDAQGNFLSLSELGLLSPSEYPFQNGLMVNPRTALPGLATVRGISVNKVHGFAPSIASTANRFQPQVESMEGAAFFYGCLMSRVPFLAIRSISNRVESRNRENWNIPLAVKNLNAFLKNWLEHLPG
jgi:futalosine hydrolase